MSKRSDHMLFKFCLNLSIQRWLLTKHAKHDMSDNTGRNG